jgi:hypothetical protein
MKNRTKTKPGIFRLFHKQMPETDDAKASRQVLRGDQGESRVTYAIS